MEQSIQEKSFWNILPDELVERILRCAIETSTYSVTNYQTYRSILQTCCRFKMIEFIGKRFLRRLYIHRINTFPKSTFNGKKKVSVQKIAPAFGSTSGAAMDIAQYVDKNWRSAWLNLSSQEYS